MRTQLLTDEQLAFFKQHGYLHLKSFVPDTVLNEVQRPINRWVNRTINRWNKKGLCADHFEGLPFDSRLYMAWKAANRPPHKELIREEIASPEIFNFLTYPVFVKLAQDLLNGQNIQALDSYMCRPKLPSSAFPIDTPWHQDPNAPQPLM